MNFFMCEIKVESAETTTIGVERTFAVGLLKHRRGRWQRCELSGLANDISKNKNIPLRCKLKFEADDDDDDGRQTDRQTTRRSRGGKFNFNVKPLLKPT